LHEITVGFLKVLSVSNDVDNVDDEGKLSILVSSCGKTIALWSIPTGQLLGSIQKDHTSVDANPEYIFVGLASGDVLAYSIHKILALQQPTEVDTDDYLETGIVARWRASDKAITALRIQTCCSNENNNKSHNNARDNLLVYTGDFGGTFKRYQVLKQQRDGILQPWPRIPTQKLADAAHLFGTTATSSPITSIVTVDDTKFLAGYSDGSVRAWNVRNGRELFRMEGFESNLQNLLVIPNHSSEWSESAIHTLVLIPNGKVVSVHDFGIEEDEDFDLDMPEYQQQN
jgi:WD40 repeat protein